MESEKVLPGDAKATLWHAVNQACQQQAGDFSEEGSKRFQSAFAMELAKLIEEHGLAATCRSLLMYESEIELPCSLRFFDLSFPQRLSEVEQEVDWIVLSDGSSVQDYVTRESENLDAECRIMLTEEVAAIVPAWEAAEIIARNRDEIEAYRQQLDDEEDDYI